MLSRVSCVWLFATPRTAAHQAPLSMGFSRQEYWSGLPCPLPGDPPNPRIECTSLLSPALAGRFFGKPLMHTITTKLVLTFYLQLCLVGTSKHPFLARAETFSCFFNSSHLPIKGRCIGGRCKDTWVDFFPNSLTILWPEKCLQVYGTWLPCFQLWFSLLDVLQSFIILFIASITSVFCTRIYALLEKLYSLLYYQTLEYCQCEMFSTYLLHGWIKERKTFYAQICIFVMRASMLAQQ